jgi:hypothetical protein
VPDAGLTVATAVLVLAALIRPAYKASDAVKESVAPNAAREMEDLLTPSVPGFTVTLADVAPPFTSVKLIVAVPPAPVWLTGVTVNEAFGPVPDDVTVATPTLVLLALMVAK